MCVCYVLCVCVWCGSFRGSETLQEECCRRGKWEYYRWRIRMCANSWLLVGVGKPWGCFRGEIFLYTVYFCFPSQQRAALGCLFKMVKNRFLMELFDLLMTLSCCCCCSGVESNSWFFGGWCEIFSCLCCAPARPVLWATIFVLFFHTAVPRTGQSLLCRRCSYVLTDLTSTWKKWGRKEGLRVLFLWKTSLSKQTNCGWRIFWSVSGWGKETWAGLKFMRRGRLKQL